MHILTLIKIVYKNLKNTKIYLITGSINKEISRELKEFNIEIIENNLLKNNSKNNIPKIIKGIYEIRKLFCLINPDLISIHSSKAGLIGRMAGLFSLRTNKIIFTEHGWPFNALESINFLIIYLLQIILSPLCKTIICTSDTLYKIILQS